MEIFLEIPKDINKVCRACLNVTEGNDKMFNYQLICDNQLTSISSFFENVTSLKVAVGDGLPESICSDCYESLENAYTYRNRCQYSEEKLKVLLERCTTNIEIEENSDTKELIESDINDTVTDVTSPLKQEYSPYNCQHCNSNFLSNYQLSKHIIEQHNTTKTISERFLENSNEEFEETDIHLSGVNMLKCILRRKRINENLNDTIELMEDDINMEDSKDGYDEINRTDIDCKICRQIYPTLEDLNQHLCEPTDTKTSEIFYKSCILCYKLFSDASALSLHFLKHAFIIQCTKTVNIQSEFLFCEVCGELFNCQQNLDQHYDNQHEGKRLWTCNECCTTFITEMELIKHNLHNCSLTPITFDTNFPCVLCTEIFPSKEELLNHSPIHLMKKYSCKKCLLSFCTQDSYNAHLKIHPGIKFYVCRTCGKNLSTKSSLKVHIDSVHTFKLLHKCTICGKSFASANRLMTHAKIHSSNKKYVCSYCGYNVHTAGDLKVHIRTHTSERPYKCTFVNCQMSFKTSSHLCTHVRRHLQIRNFKCKMCSANFGTSHSLKIHQMQHTGERPHACTICLQTFRRKYHLKVHMKQHAKCEY